MSEPLRLDGRVAAVTGSGRGLGRAHAIALAGAGVDDLGPGGAAETVVTIAARGGRCIGIGGDRLSLWSPPDETVSELREGIELGDLDLSG